VLSQTYGAFADLRRELSDSKTTVNEREDILKNFAACPDSQRAWLALEDYFEKLSLSRRDFPDHWWPRMLNARRARRAWRNWRFCFLRAKRSVPPELQPHASPDRFARAEEAEQEQKLVQELETGSRRPPCRCSTRRAPPCASSASPSRTREPSRHRLAVQFLLSRPRTGEKARTLHDMIDLVVRATHEQELFPPWDWEFIQWIADTHRNSRDGADTLVLSDAELLQWLARWGHTPRSNATASRCISTARLPRSRRISKTATRNFPSRTACRCPTAKTIPWPTPGFSTASRRSRWATALFICCATRRRRRAEISRAANRPCRCAN
jgi:hypothetical protein